MHVLVQVPSRNQQADDACLIFDYIYVHSYASHAEISGTAQKQCNLGSATHAGGSWHMQVGVQIQKAISMKLSINTLSQREPRDQKWNRIGCIDCRLRRHLY